MCSKVKWFRARKSLDSGVAPPPQAIASSWRTPVMWSSTVIRSQCCLVKKYASLQRSLRCAGRGLYGGSSAWTVVVHAGGRMRWSYGARDVQHPHRHKRHEKWCANSVRVQSHVLSVTVRPSVDLNDDSREGVRGSGRNSRYDNDNEITLFRHMK